MSVAARVIQMAEGSQDARSRLLAKVAPFLETTRIRPVGHDILVAVYNRAGQKTAGGILVPDSNREDEFQGKVALVLALGPMCSGQDYDDWFGGEPPKVGDWVGLNTRDGMSFLVGDTTVRTVEWRYLRFITQSPDKVM